MFFFLLFSTIISLNACTSELCWCFSVSFLGRGIEGQNVGLDLDPSCLTLMVFLNVYFSKVNFEKKEKDCLLR